MTFTGAILWFESRRHLCQKHRAVKDVFFHVLLRSLCHHCILKHNETIHILEVNM